MFFQHIIYKDFYSWRCLTSLTHFPQESSSSHYPASGSSASSSSSSSHGLQLVFINLCSSDFLTCLYRNSFFSSTYHSTSLSTSILPFSSSFLTLSFLVVENHPLQCFISIFDLIWPNKKVYVFRLLSSHKHFLFMVFLYKEICLMCLIWGS